MMELLKSPQLLDGFDESAEYNDGPTEEQLLELFAQGGERDVEAQIQEILENNPAWALRVHLDPQRLHLLDWYNFRKDASLLELGAGCGALTGLFCQKLRHVDTVDLSMRRSQILLRRHRHYDNLRVFVGDLHSLARRGGSYDYITVIGVLEYAGRYVAANSQSDERFDPYIQFLRDVRSLLAPGGTLLLALENQLGSKYLSGGAEDHYGQPLVGVEDYIDDQGIRTFGKAELTRLIEQAGLHAAHWYYPLPDYKLPTTVYSDDMPPGSTEHISLLYPTPDYSYPHELYFDEGRFMHVAARNGLGTVLTNSFLVECQL
jgi:SAM-dependent methyltransferase